jgi:hypothetical protein
VTVDMGGERQKGTSNPPGWHRPHRDIEETYWRKDWEPMDAVMAGKAAASRTTESVAISQM